MIKDIDLDVSNYADNDMTDKETLIYLRADNDILSHVINGDMPVMVDMFLRCEDLYDVILNAAARIVVDKDVDFDEILKLIGDEENK